MGSTAVQQLLDDARQHLVSLQASQTAQPQAGEESDGNSIAETVRKKRSCAECLFRLYGMPRKKTHARKRTTEQSQRKRVSAHINVCLNVLI